MPFDERLVLNKESRGNIIYDEHLVRYQLAAQLAVGKKVLDIACGSGYGAAILAKAGAAKVIAIDRDVSIVAVAKKEYAAVHSNRGTSSEETHPAAHSNRGTPCLAEAPGEGRPPEETHPAAHSNRGTPPEEGIAFKEGDAENIGEADGSFDLAVSFETIEHLENPEKYLAEITRVLNREGIFLVSTPNREVFGQTNPYHRHEFTRGEFETSLKKYFKNILILEQTNGLASLIKAGDYGKILFPPPAGGSAAKPLYFIAVCSNNDADLSGLFKQSVVSINISALEKIRNNPIMKMADKIYSLIKR